jgi:hypothetical protein
MARYELIKTIEAKRLNARSGAPLAEPPSTIPYSAMIEMLEENWDYTKFTYLGQNYHCATPVFKEATRPYGAKESAKPAVGESADSATAAAAAPKEVQLNWEELSSNYAAVLRAKIPGGWLISVKSSGVTFYPDPEHSWNGKTLE